MIPTISISLDTAKLKQLRGDIPQRAEAILTRGATEIQAEATENTTRVDTGAMKNGWRVEQNAPYQRTIFNTQHYAIYWELGHRNFAPEPMLSPAVEKYRQKIADAWKALFEGY